MNIQEIKKQKQNKVDNLLTSCSVFWAFSNEQFAKNKTPLQEGEKYVSIGGGGYLPKSKVADLETGFKEINKWYKDTVKDNKQRKENIIYELNNHEAFYTYEIEDTLQALGEDYTEEEVRAVFNEVLNKKEK